LKEEEEEEEEENPNQILYKGAPNGE